MTRLPTALAAIALILLGSACGRPTPPSKLRVPEGNLILISIDTTRADRLSLYGGERPTTPFLEELAADAIVFERALSTAPSTAPSHMSMMTGLYPTAHGVMNFSNAPGPDGSRTVRQALPSGIPTLAELLQDRGYATAGFTGGGNTAGVLGFARGFDLYADSDSGMSGHNDGNLVDPGRALEWIDEQHREGTPFFVFLHTYIPHSPYVPPPKFASRFNPDYDGDIPDWETMYGGEGRNHRALDRYFWKQVDESDPEDRAHLLALYDEEISYADHLVGTLFDAFTRMGLRDDTVIVITSDHGEEFYEHGGWKHFDKLWDEVLHVPLVFLLPESRGEGRRIEHPVSSIDLFPTILDLLAVDPEISVPGESLLPRLDGARPFDDRPIVSEFIRRSRPLDDGAWEPDWYLRAVQKGGWKLIERVQRVQRTEQLYHLAEDPRERRNRVLDARAAPRLRELREIARRIEEASAAWRLPLGGSNASEETLRQLRELGYIR